MKYLLLLCVAVIVMLLIKIYVMKKSARNLRADFAARGKLDTNSLIGIESRDKDLRLLTDQINKTLVELRDSYHKYNLGDKCRCIRLCSLVYLVCIKCGKNIQHWENPC